MAAKPAKPTVPKQPRSKGKVIMIFAGIGALLLGVVLMWVGIGPVVEVVGPAFGGGAPPEDLGEQLDAAIGGAAVPAGIGFVLLLGGFIVLKMGMAPPPPKSVEQQVKEEVEKRMAAMAPTSILQPVDSHGNHVPTNTPPSNIVAASRPPAAPPAQPPPARPVVARPAAAPPVPGAPGAAPGAAPAGAPVLAAVKCPRCARPLLSNGMCRVCDRPA